LLAADPTVAAKTGRLVYAVAVDDLNVYRLKRGGGEAVAVSPSATLESSPDLSPDGKQVAMRSARSGTSEVWVMGDEGTGPKKLTNAQGPVTGSPKWSPRGEWLAFDSRMRGNADVYLISSTGGEPKLMAGSEWNEAVPNWSRDGKWLYYASDQTGKWQLWKIRSDQTGQPVQVTQAGGFLARESLDGKWLYYSKREPWRGLWRCKTEGGKEELVVNLPESLWGGWALSGDGVYWVETPEKEKARIVYRAFSGGQDVAVHTFEKNPVLWDGQLAVREDGSEIYFTQLDRSVSDLYRVELQLRD
jgi:Tol biopolymer transport system component